MKKITTRRCPVCDTKNTGNVCVVCGEILSDKKPNENRNIRYFVSLLLTVIVTAAITAVIVSKTTGQKYLDRLEAADAVNKNAQVLYSAAMNYCLEAKENDKDMPDGFFSFEIESSDGTTAFNGTQEDLKSYFSTFYNAEYTQYCAINVTNGLPSTAYWSNLSISDDVLNLSLKKIVEENLTLGVFPAAWHLDEVYTYISDTSSNDETEQHDEQSETAEVRSDSFDPDKLCSEILKCINNDRKEEGIYELQQSERSKEFTEQIHSLLMNGTYQSGMIDDKKDEIADYVSIYYEKDFDVSQYSDEAEIARGLIDYEKENYSSKWMPQVHQYYYAAASFDNNTVCVVFTMIGDKTASIGNEFYDRDLTELDLSDRNLTSADIVNLPYFYNLEVLKLDSNSISGTDVFSKIPKLNTLWLDKNGITNISFLMGCKNLKVLTLNHNQISDASPFENMTQLEKLILKDNKIDDVSPFYRLTNLKELNLKDNEISNHDLNELSDALSTQTKVFGDN